MSDLIDRHRALINQIRWERDTAIAQLSQIGKGLGERMDDVVKVVRCQNCKNWNTLWFSERNLTDKIYHYCPILSNVTDENFYCADGERR